MQILPEQNVSSTANYILVVLVRDQYMEFIVAVYFFADEKSINIIKG